MATKTISIDLEAYEKLRSARRASNESFSMVIKRAVWPAPVRSAEALLQALERVPVMSDDALDRLDRAQASDRPPEDPWRAR